VKLQSTRPQTSPAAEALRGLCGGAVHLPGDPGYDDARVPWNVAIDQRPAAVAYPASTAEVAAIVRAAAAAGLRIAPQGTGHNAGPLASLDDVVLLRTSAMTGVTIDPDAGIARVKAGTLWLDVVEAAAEHGLAVLHGSSPDVGVVGYSLGGGMGWYARALGLQTNAVTAAEVVTAAGTVLHVDADTHAEIFWALRGGGGNVGIVTELEFRTFDFSTAYAGWLVWDANDSRNVLRAWSRWAADAPDAVTTSIRLLNIPPIPEMPPQFQGRHLLVIDGAVLASDDEAERILAPLRALKPEMDTFTRTPVEALVRLHMDPEGPTPVTSSTSVLAELPDEAIDALLAVAGPGSGSTLLLTELRQLGGALGRPAFGAGALPQLDGKFVFFSAAIAATPEMGAQGHADAHAAAAALAPWANERQYLNFAEESVDTSTGYSANDWSRLVAIRTAADPHGRLVANHAVSTPHIPRQR
jgi:FAD/FMN-containing dehydrogenase